MSASDEWTEYHLTPRGWEMGSDRVDGQGTTLKDPPADRVVTVRWREYLGSVYGKMKKYHEDVWESDDKAAIGELRRKFGDPPAEL
jgi:hypothetical protein